MNTPPPLIALAQHWNPLRPHQFNSNNCDIEIYIATLSDKGTPRNFSFSDSMDYPKTCTGGCFCRIWASESDGKIYHYFNSYGPEINHGGLADYEYAVRALKVVNKRSEAIYRQRGVTDDVATLAGQWLEACGVTQVYVRPDSSRHVSWLNEGEWNVWDLGRTVNEIRQKYYKLPEPQLQPA